MRDRVQTLARPGEEIGRERDAVRCALVCALGQSLVLGHALRLDRIHPALCLSLFGSRWCAGSIFRFGLAIELLQTGGALTLP